MHKNGVKLALTTLICSLLTWPNLTTQADEVGSSTSEASKTSLFVYHPPKRGAPKSRVGGGTRNLSLVQVLAPKHIGLTCQSQPRLYWYLQPGIQSHLRIKLSSTNKTVPVLNEYLPTPPSGGIQTLDLAQYSYQLKPGLIYSWQISLDPIPGKSRQQLVSKSAIKFIGPDAELDATDPHHRPYTAAERGLWYDALDWVSRLVATESDSNYWRHQRADLLNQGNLEAIAILEQRTIMQ